ncbi:MAG: hypothetical protein KW793_03325 [Candidatus Doudnabacteria bacterium]|nr:hypothetical protein [Candidatus Doudnabacteria bacterium]
MFNKISSLVLGLAMFMVFIGSVRSVNDFYIFLTSLIILLVAVTAINIKRIGFTWPHILLPVIYIVGVGSIFVVITSPGVRSIFLFFASLVLYFLELQLGRESHFLQNVYLFSVFAWMLGLFAVVFYLDVDTEWAVLSAFLATYVLIVQGFAGFSLPAKKYFNFLIALICAQAAWGLLFWPTHYLVNAVVLFCLFYLLWIFSFSAFFGKLSVKKIYWQLALVFVVLLITLTTASWQPLFT